MIVYSNYKAFKCCPVKSKCTSSQHRTISRYVHDLSLEAENLLNTPFGKKEYAKRISTIEPPNGTFIRVYNYDRLPIIGKERVQSLMFSIAAAYNTIRLYNIIRERRLDIIDVIDDIRLIFLGMSS